MASKLAETVAALIRTNPAMAENRYLRDDLLTPGRMPQSKNGPKPAPKAGPKR